MSVLKELLLNKILVVDGAMGTELAKLGLTAQDYGGARYEGCGEYLCVSKPEAVCSVHDSYLQAGADIIETCSFGATSVMLREFGLESKARDINTAAARAARRSADKFSTNAKPRFVAGSMGPTSKSLFVSGGISFDELRSAYYEQALGLADGGVDLFLIETATDVLNIKAAADAAFEAAQKRAIPVIVSASFGAGGMAGADINSLTHSKNLKLVAVAVVRLRRPA